MNRQDEQEHSQRPHFFSLTWRWVAWILGTCGILYLGTLVYSHSLSEEMIIRGAEREAENAARAWVNEVEEVLRSLEESTGLLGDALGSLDLSDEDLERLLRAFVAGNPRYTVPRRLSYRLDFARLLRGSLPIIIGRVRKSSSPIWRTTPTSIGSGTGTRKWSSPASRGGPNPISTRVEEIF